MLTREEVQKIAKLARLDLTDAEIETYRTKLSQVLDHMKDLAKVSASTAQVPHVPSDSVAFREDVAVAFPNPEALLDLAPEKEAGHYTLPALWTE